MISRRIKTFVLVFAAAALALGVSENPACAAVTRTEKLPFAITASTDVKEINAECVLDKTFEIALKGNQAAGWFWSECSGLPQGITFVSQNFVPDPPQPQTPEKKELHDKNVSADKKTAVVKKAPVGTPGTVYRTYSASRTGSFHFYLQCQRPGEPTPTLFAIVRVKVRLP